MSNKRAKALAKELLAYENSHRPFDDGISICEYLSRQRGIELTIAEVDRVQNWMQILSTEPSPKE